VQTIYIIEENAKTHILIVEKDISSQQLMKYFLKGQGDLSFAASVRRSKEIINNRPVDLVFLDLSLQGDEGGLELAKFIRKTNLRIPIIVVTAIVLQTNREEALQAGCNDFISKPVRCSDIVGAVHKYFPASAEKVKQ